MNFDNYFDRTYIKLGGILGHYPFTVHSGEGISGALFKGFHSDISMTLIPMESHNPQD